MASNDKKAVNAELQGLDLFKIQTELKTRISFTESSLILR